MSKFEGNCFGLVIDCASEWKVVGILTARQGCWENNELCIDNNGLEREVWPINQTCFWGRKFWNTGIRKSCCGGQSPIYLCCESTSLCWVDLLRVISEQSCPRICFADLGNVELNIADEYCYKTHTDNRMSGHLKTAGYLWHIFCVSLFLLSVLLLMKATDIFYNS